MGGENKAPMHHRMKGPTGRGSGVQAPRASSSRAAPARVDHASGPAGGCAHSLVEVLTSRRFCAPPTPPLQTGWGNFFSNLIFWVCVLAAKFAFDWFALMKPLETPVRALWHNGWLAPKTNGGGLFQVGRIDIRVVIPAVVYYWARRRMPCCTH